MGKAALLGEWRGLSMIPEFHADLRSHSCGTGLRNALVCGRRALWPGVLRHTHDTRKARATRMRARKEKPLLMPAFWWEEWPQASRTPRTHVEARVPWQQVHSPSLPRHGGEPPRVWLGSDSKHSPARGFRAHRPVGLLCSAGMWVLEEHAAARTEMHGPS